ncbi:Flp family type IVb pilin [Caulobacter sp. NIBR2454]|uniref:Flp family type IVb pilin n=1 Tax=Caulobacter sp. NIBR2454 TaxID=3015996 RepID=UPI0022B64F85|nr:Flp family type IVb pilin [Caulobacter sp. NIBR2454]
MSKFFNRFLKDASGATAIEYGLIIAAIAVTVITVFGVLGTNLEGKLQEAADELAQ